VLLKRGMAASLADLLLSAEYVSPKGTPTSSSSAASADSTAPAKPSMECYSGSESALPSSDFADPSHATSKRAMVPRRAAAVAAGADGLLIEVHVNPVAALSDGAQSLYPEQFALLMDELRGIATAVGRSIAGPR
jgi:3-deoxy-7-phosphoheptulonate synthase